MTSSAGKPGRFPLRLGSLQPATKPPPPTTPPRSPELLKTATATATAAKLSPIGTTAPAASMRTLLRPQEHLRNAHRDAGRQTALSSGIGLDSVDVRRRMAVKLRAAGVSSEPVLDAMASIPRHLFVDAALVTQAYEDTSLPIGHGQTISKPSVVARMIELLMDGVQARRTHGLGRVLEIGTGCGYQAAVLALLGRHVVSVERLKPLHEKARTLLAPLRKSNLRLVYGDGMLGHPPNAPYDSIIAAAGGDDLPAVWLDQLAIGGRLVSPVRQAGSAHQVLIVVDRTEQGCRRWVCEAVRFVPLQSGVGA